MTFPTTIRAGDYIQWRLPASQDVFGNSISSPDWSVIYYLRTNLGPLGATINSSAYNDGFQFTIASNVTETFAAGDWYYQAVANKSGAGRSQVEKDLETIETAIRTLISGGAIKEYKIGNRNAKKYELAELLTLKSQYKVELVREKQAETMANGLGNPRATFVRFDGGY